MNPKIASEYKSNRVFSAMSRGLTAAGKNYNVIHSYKEPRHGKSTINAQGGRFKQAMRRYEHSKGFFMIHGLSHFISEAADGHQCFYNKNKGIYKVNFLANDVILNDGSMSYNPNIFNKMREKPVIKDGVTYRSGIRNVHSIKVCQTPFGDQAELIYAIALSPCPSACRICYATIDKYCDEVIHRHISIPKQKFVLIPKRVYGASSGQEETGCSTSKRKK